MTLTANMQDFADEVVDRVNDAAMSALTLADIIINDVAFIEGMGERDNAHADYLVAMSPSKLARLKWMAEMVKSTADVAETETRKFIGQLGAQQ